MERSEMNKWIKGNPAVAGYYLVTYVRKDNRHKAAGYMWFNPDAIGKWYFVGTRTICASGELTITHWMPLPEPAI